MQTISLIVAWWNAVWPSHVREITIGLTQEDITRDNTLSYLSSKHGIKVPDIERSEAGSMQSPPEACKDEG
jgi:hypothetical protein